MLELLQVFEEFINEVSFVQGMFSSLVGQGRNLFKQHMRNEDKF